MKAYNNIVSLKVGDHEFAGRFSEMRVTEEPPDQAMNPGVAHGELTFECHAHLPAWETTELLEAISAQGRLKRLIWEISAAECELFAAMLRFWSFL